jgi:hypothetical protein
MQRRHALAPPSVSLSVGTMRDFCDISACVGKKTEGVAPRLQLHPNIEIIYNLLKKALLYGNKQTAHSFQSSPLPA